MTKYKEYAQKMIEDNKELFDAFKPIHDQYSLDTKGMQQAYNEIGSRINDIIREYEDRLCRNTERGMYNKFSGGLSEKFRAEIKKIFPMIDHIGLVPQESVAPSTTITEMQFTIKKIQL